MNTPQTLPQQLHQLGHSALYAARGRSFAPYEVGDHVFVPNVREAIEQQKDTLPATAIKQDGTTGTASTLNLPPLTADEREICSKGVS